MRGSNGEGCRDAVADSAASATRAGEGSDRHDELLTTTPFMKTSDMCSLMISCVSHRVGAEPSPNSRSPAITHRDERRSPRGSCARSPHPPPLARSARAGDSRPPGRRGRLDLVAYSPSPPRLAIRSRRTSRTIESTRRSSHSPIRLCAPLQSPSIARQRSSAIDSSSERSRPSPTLAPAPAETSREAKRG